jgi:glucose-6-phosphate 1-dehydrogenase
MYSENTAMKKPENFILVIFGGSGDLTEKKLIPALSQLYNDGYLPDRLSILGLGRTSHTDESYREKLRQQLSENEAPGEAAEKFLQQVHYLNLNMREREDYEKLRSQLEQLDAAKQIGGNYLFYLATPPEFFEDVSVNLGWAGLNNQGGRGNWRRLVIEKPFGHDLESAIALNRRLKEVWQENQIFRIDHYLGKETVQNILAFRFANGIFEPLWNRNYIHHVEITAAETAGVGSRGGYFDQAGTMRDMVQNHLLQILATVAMEPPPVFEMNQVRDEKRKVFQSLRPIAPEELSSQLIRGQYIASTVRGEHVNGYREEKNVDPASQTDTYIALKLFIDNWRWGGIPFYIRTGKRMPTRVTEVVIHFNRTPHALFRSGDGENQLILRIQPDEGILLKFGMKLPGSGFEIKNVAMDFHYADLTGNKIPDAYERLILDALLGDATLFARSDEVEAAWKFVDPIITGWQRDPELKIFGYPAGTWGPREAAELLEPGMDWRYPCKNLTNEDTYCEL